MNNKYTAVMAEQQNNFTIPGYDRMLFAQHDNNCLQHHVYQERQQVPTSSSLGYIDSRITASVSFIDRIWMFVLTLEFVPLSSDIRQLCQLL